MQLRFQLFQFLNDYEVFIFSEVLELELSFGTFYGQPFFFKEMVYFLYRYNILWGILSGAPFFLFRIDFFEFLSQNLSKEGFTLNALAISPML